MYGRSRRRGAAPADVVIDLTEGAPWLTASTDASVVEPAGRRRFGRRGTPSLAPKGEKHAYRLHGDTTACGVPVADLHAWDDERFGDGLLNRCLRCLELTRSTTSHGNRLDSAS